jgi:hypothetical protein
MKLLCAEISLDNQSIHFLGKKLSLLNENCIVLKDNMWRAMNCELASELKSIYGARY